MAQKRSGQQQRNLKLHSVFGLTFFVALDPDGHRIRVCMPDKDK